VDIRSILDKLDYLAEEVAPRNGEWLGDNIGKIQQGLVDLGFSVGPKGVDSNFGPDSAAAVRAFQQANNLKVDGDPGPETVAVMNKLLADPSHTKPGVAADSAVQKNPEDAKKLEKLATELEKSVADYEKSTQGASQGTNSLANAGLRAGGIGLRAASSAAKPIAKIAGKTLGHGFGLLATGSDIYDAYKSFEKGDYTNAALSGGAAALSTLGRLPGAAIGAGINGYQAYNNGELNPILPKSLEKVQKESIGSLHHRLELIEKKSLIAESLDSKYYRDSSNNFYSSKGDKITDQLTLTVIQESAYDKKITIARRLDEDWKDWVSSAGSLALIAKYGNPASRVIDCVQSCWSAYEKIRELPKPDKNNSKSVANYKSTIAKIIGKLIDQFGLFLVGSAVGGMVGGIVGSPGGLLSIATGLLGSIAGGMATQAIWGDDVDAFVEWVIDQVYPEGADNDDSADDSSDNSENDDTENVDDTASSTSAADGKSAIYDLQNALSQAGFEVDSNGEINDDTINAVREYRDSIGAATDTDAIAKLLGISVNTDSKLHESINYNKLSDVDKMSFLVSKISLLEDRPQLSEGPFNSIAKHIPFTTAFSKKIADEVIGNIPTLKNALGQTVKLTSKNGYPFKRLTGQNSDLYSDGHGITLTANQIKARLAKAEQQNIGAVQSGTEFRSKAPGQPERIYTKDTDGVWKYDDAATGKRMRIKPGSDFEREVETAAKSQGNVSKMNAPMDNAAPNVAGTTKGNKTNNKTNNKTPSSDANVLNKSSFPKRLAGLVFNKKMIAFAVALEAFGYVFDHGNFKAIKDHLFPGGDKDTDTNTPSVPKALLALIKQIKDLEKSYGYDTDPAWVAARKHADSILAKLGFPIEDISAGKSVAPTPIKTPVQPKAAEPAAPKPAAPQPAAPQPTAPISVNNGPWPASSPQAAVYAKLSPADQKWLGGADPTDPYILSRSPNKGIPPGGTTPLVATPNDRNNKLNGVNPGA
jgi:hypothetical protein